MPRTKLLLSLFFLSYLSLQACGPYFPNTMLPGDDAFKSIPVAIFEAELKRIKLDRKEDFSYIDNKKIDLISELRQALKQTMASDNAEEAITGYQKLRETLNKHRADYLFHQDRLQWSDEEKPITNKALPIPQGLPKEYQLYLEGANAYYALELKVARQKWHELLGLPKEKRQFRTTWALYMLARTGTFAEADKTYPMVRQAVKEGFADSTGLAQASYGWQAHAELKLKNHATAIELYFIHFKTGRKDALISLRWALEGLFGEITKSEDLDWAAKSPFHRQIISAYILSQNQVSSRHSTQINNRKFWLESLKKKQVKDSSYSDRFAWLAYKFNDIRSCQSYLAQCQESPISLWVRTRLSLREGKKSQALEQLRLLSLLLKKHSEKAYPTYDADSDEDYFYKSSHTFAEQVIGEMALISLESAQFEQALFLLMKADFWTDAAYLAERVLQIDELIRFVKRTNANPNIKKNHNMQLASLLARRLTREGQWKKARLYFKTNNYTFSEYTRNRFAVFPSTIPAEEKKKLFDLYISSIQQGHDKKLSRKQRADAFWQAALIACNQGMDLIGTELTPDFAIYNGGFKQDDLGKTRLLLDQKGKLKLSEEEKKRLQLHPIPNRRYHYKYIAVKHAWNALQLMPNNDTLTAHRFVIAGSWVKVSTPKTADKFYKALVRRCGKTKLGQEADKLRWFPSIKDTKGLRETSESATRRDAEKDREQK